ncbi:DUF5131 family protein [Phenylobacterium sp.]|uniref:DUF5131 family protein n=1 Tax=Phenylobacterium sp. TaxID=1871053 RepID=UPI00394C4F77
MADNSLIEWTDATWNPVTGCAVVSPGCANCYAMRLAGGRLQHHPSRAGLTTPSKAGPVWNGQVRLNWDWLDQPIRWKRPRKIFVCAHGDLFAEGVPTSWIDRVYAAMMLAPQHTFQVLTKRSRRMRDYWTNSGEFGGEAATAAMRIQGHALEYLKTGRFHAAGYGPHYAAELREHGGRLRRLPLTNVWHGVSVEDQDRDFRIRDLIETPSQVRFISAEPLIGPLLLPRVDFHCDLCGGTGILARWPRGRCHQCNGRGILPAVSTDPKIGAPSTPMRRIDLVIVGGENGPRPMHPEWVRKIRDDCTITSTAFFFKQWGSHRPVRWSEDGQTPDFPPALALAVDGTVTRGPFPLETLPATAPRPRWCIMAEVGKSAAGRLLDGRTHDAMPEVRA